MTTLEFRHAKMIHTPTLKRHQQSDWTSLVAGLKISTPSKSSRTISGAQLGKHCSHGPLARYIKLRVAHVPGMPGTFSPPSRVNDSHMHHGTCVTHVPWCMPGSPTSVFLWSRWRGKRSRHSPHMRNPQFYVSGKRPMPLVAPFTNMEYLWPQHG